MKEINFEKVDDISFSDFFDTKASLYEKDDGERGITLNIDTTEDSTIMADITIDEKQYQTLKNQLQRIEKSSDESDEKEDVSPDRVLTPKNVSRSVQAIIKVAEFDEHDTRTPYRIDIQFINTSKLNFHHYVLPLTKEEYECLEYSMRK